MDKSLLSTVCNPLILLYFFKSYNYTRTTSLRTIYRSQRLLFKSSFSLILSQLLSKLNSLRFGFTKPVNFKSYIYIPITPEQAAYRMLRLFMFASKIQSAPISLLLVFAKGCARLVYSGPKTNTSMRGNIDKTSCHRAVNVSMTGFS